MKLAWLAVVAVVLSGCGGGGSSSSERPESVTSPTAESTSGSGQVYSYQSTSLSEQVLECSTAILQENPESCDVGDIKPIGVEVSGNVTIDDIKSRLVVSHDWMAESFIAALEQINDQDLLNMFKALNTIVISYDIRPSFYHSLTASMYIDSRYLWRNLNEWNSIYQQDDFREAYQSEFIFDAFMRYVDASSNEYVTYSNTYNAVYNYSRAAEHIAPGLFRLLSHELAHANDYLPASTIAAIGSNGKIYDDYIYTADHAHDALDNHDPLTSTLLKEAAQVAFQGADMTDLIRSTTAYEAGVAFEDDGAADFYGYSNNREDVAMLFEALMMYKKYNAVSDVAFVTIPAGSEVSCNDYVVKWGQRARLADSKVKERALWVAQRILGEDFTTELNSLPDAPVDLLTDVGWCYARTNTSTASSEQVASAYSGRAEQPVYHNFLEDGWRE